MSVNINQWVSKLSECLALAQESDDELGNSESNRDGALLHWLERQLLSIITELQLMLSDIENGIEARFLGFDSDSELEELIDSFEIEINRLKGRIRILREVGRGR